MTTTYIHAWKDIEGIVYIPEQMPTYSLLDAVEEYYQQKSDWYSYFCTYIIKDDDLTSYKNIEEYIEEQRILEEELEEEEKEYDKQRRSDYYKNLGV